MGNQQVRVGRHRDVPMWNYDPRQLRQGIQVQKEHTDDPLVARQIAKDHLAEIPDYYTRLLRMQQQASVTGQVPMQMQQQGMQQQQLGPSPVNYYEPQHMKEQLLSQLQQALPQQQQQQQLQQQMVPQQQMQVQQQEPKEDEADDASFGPKLESKKRKGLVFVFFYMSHCPHCRRMMPAVQRMVHAMPNMYLMRCDIKRCPNMQKYMQVQAAPTSFLMKGGQWVDRIDGAISDEELQQKLMQV